MYIKKQNDIKYRYTNILKPLAQFAPYVYEQEGQFYFDLFMNLT